MRSGSGSFRNERDFRNYASKPGHPSHFKIFEFGFGFCLFPMKRIYYKALSQFLLIGRGDCTL